MDITDQYGLFGICLVSTGIVAICLIGCHHWKHSRQRRQEEVIKFWNNLQEMQIDPGVVAELMKKMKSTEDFERANRKMTKKHKPIIHVK